MYQKLLLCTDGSPMADTATDYTAWLAAKLHARVRALYVTDIRLLEGPLLADFSGALGAQPYSALLPKLQEVQREKAGAILQSAAQRCRDRGVTCDTLHETGRLVHILLAEEEQADLVVLGQRGEHAEWTGDLLGSSVERMVRASQKPCLVTPEKFREITRLLLAYDGSTESRKGLEAGLALAKALTADVTILTVCQSDTEKSGSRFLQDAHEQAQTRGLSVHTQLARGEPKSEILVWSDKLDADLIVMGAYGHTRIREFILGSTTSHVMRKATVPVLLARG